MYISFLTWHGWLTVVGVSTGFLPLLKIELPRPPLINLPKQWLQHRGLFLFVCMPNVCSREAHLVHPYHISTRACNIRGGKIGKMWSKKRSAALLKHCLHPPPFTNLPDEWLQCQSNGSKVCRVLRGLRRRFIGLSFGEQIPFTGLTLWGTARFVGVQTTAVTSFRANFL